MRDKLRKISAGICGLAVVAATITVATPAAHAAPTVAPLGVENVVNDSNQQTIIDTFNGINAFRASKGLAPLTFSVPISAISQKWSNTMAETDTFYHNPDFTTGAPEGHASYSEIIAARWDRSGQGLVNQWIDSAPHNAIMSLPDMTTVGIGVAYTDGNYSTPDRYATYGTANLFKYNGVPSNTYTSPADYFAGNPPLETNLSSVLPVEPTFASTTYTIPNVTGVKYVVNGVDKQPGTYDVTESFYNVRAYPVYGHYFPSNAGVTQWGVTYQQPETQTVTVPDPTIDTAKSTFQLHHVFGVEYTVNGVVRRPGIYYSTINVDIKANATAGYVIDPSSRTSWTHDFTPPPPPPAPPAAPEPQSTQVVTPAAPEFDTVVGSYTIPNVTGVIYKLDDVTVVETGTYNGTGIVTITATPAEGYEFSSGAATLWAEDITPHVNTVVAAAPTANSAAGSYTIPSSEGVSYTVNGAQKTAGTYTQYGTFNVVAHALYGYALEGTTTWTLTLKAPAPAAPLLKSGDMIASDSRTGVLWKYGNRYATGRKALFSSGYATVKEHYNVDWNSDGVSDILTQWKSGSMTIRYGTKTGTFSASKVIGNGWQSFDIAVSKFKRTDRYPSIIAKDSIGRLWHYTNAYGTGINGRVLKGSGWKYLTVNLLDWDKDGGMDILAKTTKGSVLLYRTNGYGAFKSEARKAIGGGWTSFQMQSVRDYAGAGTQGILAKDSAGRLYYYGTGRGAWVPRVYKGSDWLPMNVAG